MRHCVPLGNGEDVTTQHLSERESEGLAAQVRRKRGSRNVTPDLLGQVLDAALAVSPAVEIKLVHEILRFPIVRTNKNTRFLAFCQSWGQVSGLRFCLKH